MPVSHNFSRLAEQPALQEFRSGNKVCADNLANDSDAYPVGRKCPRFGSTADSGMSLPTFGPIAESGANFIKVRLYLQGV
jgi:hypothetical protein